ncbi:MAG: hypothetical protein EA423_11940 [Phycisphaerales bacterium]|nr:MAG: hypothetical protein EA423_11940 [Phycisphaerales bacterium]
MERVDAHEARKRFDELLQRVQAGETFVFTLDGDPIARLNPCRSSGLTARTEAIARIRVRRKGKPSLSADEIRRMIAEGRKR